MRSRKITSKQDNNFSLQNIKQLEKRNGTVMVSLTNSTSRGRKRLDVNSLPYVLWRGDVASMLKELPDKPLFDLVVTSPPYNLGKEYENKTSLENYLNWQKKIIGEVVRRVKKGGSVCWQVGNYVENGHIIPLDILLHPIFAKHNLKLRNRIIWKFGHGLHTKKRFSGRYEVVMWYSVDDEYQFNLDAVRIPAKYPAKRYYKGPKVGEYSSHPLGKNPEDVWDKPDEIWEIPNVKSNHIEKTAHPCQFPVGLIERLVLALTNKGDLVFDPFAGAGSSGVAAAIHGRRFWGAELTTSYVKIANERINAALNGKAKYRSHTKPIFDHTTSKLSIPPKR